MLELKQKPLEIIELEGRDLDFHFTSETWEE